LRPADLRISSDERDIFNTVDFGQLSKKHVELEWYEKTTYKILHDKWTHIKLKSTVDLQSATYSLVLFRMCE